MEVCIIIEIIMYVGKTLPMVSSVVVSAAVLEYKNGQIRILCQRKTWFAWLGISSISLRQTGRPSVLRAFPLTYNQRTTI